MFIKYFVGYLFQSSLEVPHPGGLSHLSVSSSYLPDTLETDEKKDESPRLSFFLSAVGL